MPRTISRHAGAVRQRMGPVIHQVRTERGLTLAELAQAAGIAPSHLSRIERGVTRSSDVVLDAIADALETDMAALRAAEAAAETVDARLDPLLAQLGMPEAALAELRQVSPSTRQQLLDALSRRDPLRLEPVRLTGGSGAPAKVAVCCVRGRLMRHRMLRWAVGKGRIP